MAKKKHKYYVRPDGLHEAIRTINGKRVAFRGRTDAEVERKMIEYRAELAKGRSFKAIAADFEAEHFPTLAANTLRSYRAPLSRAVSHFADTPAQSITPPDIKRFITDFAARGYARKTVATQFQICNLIFRWAVEHGDCQTNPCTSVSIPRGLKKEHRDAAPKAEEEIIKENPDLWLFPYFILYTGMRKGEALAIQGRDIDRKAMVIHVTKSLYHEYGHPRIKEPKTEAGVRDIPLLLPLLPHLPKRMCADQYLFSADGGKTPLTETEFRRLWRNYVRSTCITCTPHQLRHSFATMLFEAGLQLKDCQDLLGHSTASMTQDVYTHLRESRRAETAKLLNSLIVNGK